MGSVTIHRARATSRSWRLRLAAVSLACLLPASVFAAAYKCISPAGRVTFSDQPCTVDEESSEIELRGIHTVGSAFGGAAAKPAEGAEGEEGDGKEKPPSEEPKPEEPPAPTVDPRIAQVERLEALLGELQASLELAGRDCTAGTKVIDGWLSRSGAEVKRLNVVWGGVNAQPKTAPDLAEPRDRTRDLLKKIRSLSLSQLTARCWQDGDLVESVDDLREQLPE